MATAGEARLRAGRAVADKPQHGVHRLACDHGALTHAVAEQPDRADGRSPARVDRLARGRDGQAAAHEVPAGGEVDSPARVGLRQRDGRLDRF